MFGLPLGGTLVKVPFAIGERLCTPPFWVLFIHNQSCIARAKSGASCTHLKAAVGSGMRLVGKTPLRLLTIMYGWQAVQLHLEHKASYLL